MSMLRAPLVLYLLKSHKICFSMTSACLQRHFDTIAHILASGCSSSVADNNVVTENEDHRGSALRRHNPLCERMSFVKVLGIYDVTGEIVKTVAAFVERHSLTSEWEVWLAGWPQNAPFVPPNAMSIQVISPVSDEIGRAHV